jgi:hypothetical protein
MYFIPDECRVSGGTTPGASAWRLVRSNLTATSKGNKYFLLLVDDLSRYMWIAVIPSMDRATDAIKDI